MKNLRVNLFKPIARNITLLSQELNKSNLYHVSFKALTFLSMLYCFGCSTKDATYSLLPDQDTFQQSTQSVSGKIDILWVIDNSGSMESSQTNLAASFQSFIGQFTTRGYDFQMAVTSTDAFWAKYTTNTTQQNNFARYKKGSINGPSSVRIFKPTNPTLSQDFINTIRQGTSGSGDERAFQSMKTALEFSGNSGDGFPRSDAFLAIIIVSDEDDASRDQPPSSGTSTELHSVESYVNFLNQLTGGGAASISTKRKFSVNTISILDQACLNKLKDDTQKISTRYAQLSNATEGLVSSLCENFGTTLANISASISQLATTFYLTRTPLVETIKVSVSGKFVPRDDNNGWVYLADKNAIQFRGSFIPEQGSTIGVDFDPATLE